MRILEILFATIIAFSLNAQKDGEIEIIKDSDGKTIKFYAKSYSKDALIVEFSINGKGFTADRPFPVKEKVNPLAKQALVTITPGAGAMEMSIDYKYYSAGSDTNGGIVTEKAVPKTTSIPAEELSKGIVVFSKDGCGRCTYATKFLKDNNIPFKELNITKYRGDSELMWKKLKEAGHSANTVSTPVIMVDGVAKLNTPDLNSFLSQYKKK